MPLSCRASRMGPGVCEGSRARCGWVARHRPPRARASTRDASPRAGATTRAEALPYATIALVALGCAGWVLVRGDYLGAAHLVGSSSTTIAHLIAVSEGNASFIRMAIVGPLHGDWWKLFTNPARLPERALRVHHTARNRNLRLAAGAPPRAGRGAHRVLRRQRDGRACGGRALLRTDRQRRQRGRPSGCSPPGRSPTWRPRAGVTTTRVTCSARARSRRCCSCCPTRGRRRAGWRGSSGPWIGLLLGFWACDRLDPPEL